MGAIRLVDLFCGAGGVAEGYRRAGITDIVGVDLAPQPHYPFDFVQADAMTYPLEGFDLIHASPPCQRYSVMTKRWGRGESHPDLIGPTRERLIAAGVPYVIENVVGARRELRDPIMLCGSGFGLAVRRHRLFESNIPLLGRLCQHGKEPALQVNGHPGGSSKRDPKARFGSLAEWRAGMGIDWMTAPELAEAIPPAFTEFIGQQIMRAKAWQTNSPRS